MRNTQNLEAFKWWCAVLPGFTLLAGTPALAIDKKSVILFSQLETSSGTVPDGIELEFVNIQKPSPIEIEGRIG